MQGLWRLRWTCQLDMSSGIWIYRRESEEHRLGFLEADPEMQFLCKSFIEKAFLGETSGG